jgi:multicomponent Na+:H+ antiporter subunit A
MSPAEAPGGMSAALLLSFAVALAAPWIARWRSGRGAWLLVLLPVALAGYYAALAPGVAGGAVLVAVYEWLPLLDVDLALRGDGLSLIFALLISVLGALVVAYSISYLGDVAHRGRFYAYLLLFMSAMLGIAFADNLLALYVFWELTSITSYLLIGFHSEREEARSAAQQSLVVTSACGLVMLAGFVLLSIAAGGTFRISEIVDRADAVRAHALYAPALVTIAIGAFAKSAQFPLHFWLPNAMAAPTPVSAYLHSAALVKAGVYLLARLHPALGGTTLWLVLLTSVGAVTMVIGALLALRNTDLKRVLAYSTMAVLGMLVFLLGAGTAASVAAAMVLLVAHALYKGALFLVAGAVDHQAGSRDVRELGGLARSMPITAAAVALAAASMAGLPPLLGFAFKEMAYGATLELATAPVLLSAVVVLSNALAVVAAGVVAVRPFWGRGPVTGASEAPAAMWLPPMLLAVAGVVLGVFPGPVTRLVIDPAISAILGQPVPAQVSAQVSVVPHWSPELLLSALTLAAGLIGYACWDRIRAALDWLDRALAGTLGPERVYHLVFKSVQRVAVLQTRAIQHGYLRYYLLTIFATYLLLVSGAMIDHSVPAYLPRSLPAVAVHEWMLLGLAVAAALAATFMRSHLNTVVALAVLGFAIALLFLLLGAIDLAMTQFLVETLIIVILLLVLRRLPVIEPLSRPRFPMRAFKLAFSIAFGLLVTLLLIGVTRQPFDDSVSEYYGRTSVPEGHGSNVVNVILVDFRALDTLGEILVIATAALGAWALLRARAASGGEGSR